MPTTKLSPKEENRLERFMTNVSRLSRKEILTETNAFIMKQQMRAVLQLLGANFPGKVLIAHGVEIMRDIWPFKERRLRNLINGRRR